MATRNALSSRGPVVAATTEDRRAQILRVSGELFAELGYASTTVRNIGERTGLHSGSLYHYFQSKDAILEQILNSFVTYLITEVKRVVAEFADDPEMALRELVRVTTMAIEEHRAAIVLLQNEVASKMRGVPNVAPLVKQGEIIRKAWTGVIKKGQASGAISPNRDPELIYRFARDTIWVVARWYQPGGHYTLAEIAEEYATVIFDGIRKK
jgi:AcrR family transcriptional regulator